MYFPTIDYAQCKFVITHERDYTNAHTVSVREEQATVHLIVTQSLTEPPTVADGR